MARLASVAKFRNSFDAVTDSATSLAPAGAEPPFRHCAREAKRHSSISLESSLSERRTFGFERSNCFCASAGLDAARSIRQAIVVFTVEISQRAAARTGPDCAQIQMCRNAIEIAVREG